ncbi:MAG: hypothetical protein R2874_01685 [Desulfobacterales bacterium]
MDEVIRIFDFSPKALDPVVRKLMENLKPPAAGDFESRPDLEELRALGVNIQDDKILMVYPT